MASWYHPENFNPRSPYGERLVAAGTSCAVMLFQSTLPLRGATSLLRICAHCFGISIHAPLTGSDAGWFQILVLDKHFNPRSPYGERHVPCASNSVSIIFQSTLPLRGATGLATSPDATPGFQSTLPLRGATGSVPGLRGSLNDFNPRSPYGERPKYF